ncbi:DUF4393 domain-containing protein [Lactobacillus sp. UMNPBX1]|uniref:DUF4393 domain-containing protein n=1 Tax=Lactobacillus TaxID=1578 RepID=UPI000B5DADA2|nr:MULTISPECIES: DUF4393 domain-containing protein [Lactobacillus]OXC39814.1 hypothetical protein AYP91_05855 [Lactobacillus crispatus]PEH12388.1 DUF4393 domain-containing protein [Lactobacillus sp. UMNPBX1]
MLDPITLEAIKDLIPESTRELLFNPAANEVGKGIGALLSMLFSPLLTLNVIEKQKLAKFADKIANKVNNIPEEDRDFDKPGLALKALEESRYQISNDLLQDMFSSLLASGVNNQKNEDITPRYATVLSQIGFKDAVFLQELNNQEGRSFPIAKSRHTYDVTGSSFQDASDPFLCNEGDEIKRVPIESVDVLQSLGIIKQEEFLAIAEKEFQNKYELLDDYLRNKDKGGKYYIKIIPGVIHPTNFGNHLLDCIFE